MKIPRFSMIVFIVLHAVILCAGFFAPYDPSAQNREYSFAPPTRLHWRDETGKLNLRPFVYGLTGQADSGYSEDHHLRYPVGFFSLSTARSGERRSLHLFAVEEPGRIFILGTDEFGRDVLSRILYGGRVSIAAGFLAMLISLSIGIALGATAGMAGGVLDSAIMRLSELGLALSWIYLLLALRAFLPLRTPPLATTFLVAGVLGFTGWARSARLIRGVVLSAKEHGFVLSARGFGAGEFYLFRRHIVPQLLPLVATQGVILLPQFIMAEVTLSFLGLGATEPVASWGSLLADVQQYRVLTSYWWMLIPILVVTIFAFSYFLILNSLQKRGQSVTI